MFPHNMESKGNTENQAPNIHSEHVKEEFYKWFESRGLLSDLRAYMRQLMVKTLEEANKNGKTVRQSKAATSPKLQAINLLVVDYLFHEDYLYTVSVFASEAQILDSLPQYSSYVTQTVREHRWEPSALPRFSQQETEDILDTLRLPPSHLGARQATQLYLSGHESLLTCVVRTLATSGLKEDLARPDSVPREENLEERAVGCSHQLWSQEMEDLLLLAGVKLQHIRRMQQKWAVVIEEERAMVRQEEEAQRMEWERETEQRVREEVVEQLREQQSRVEMREQGFTTLAEQLTAVHDDITDRLAQLQLQREELEARDAQTETAREQLEERLSQLQVREEALQVREEALQVREEVLQVREEALQSAIASFEEQVALTTSIDDKEDQVVNPEVESKTTKEACVQVSSADVQPVVTVQTQTADPAVAVHTQTINSIDQEQQTSQGSEPDPQLLLQLQTEREKISELQEENLELRAHALQQRHRIDELTNRAASLSNQLEESQISVMLLRGQERGVIVTPPPPPPAPAHPSPPVFIAPTFGFNSPQRCGAGEESLLTPRAQQSAPRPDSRRRPVRFAFSQNQNPTSEESSPTDDIIQNARSRIQQLEEESASVQRNYRAFQARLMSSDSVMFPPLGSSLRTRNTPIRMRTSDVMPLLSFSRVPYRPDPVNYRSTFRPVPVPVEHNEDSSSDQTTPYESGRIDSLTNSRRMFNQRNIRQFERWKLFKKKFQRRDTLDHNRRNIRVSQSNTSSEDDEGDLRNARRRHEGIKHNKLLTEQRVETQIPNTNIQEVNQTSLHFVNNASVEANKSESNASLTMVPINNEKALDSRENVDASNLQKTENKLKLYVDLEQSVKLIESVKVLLGAQNVVNPASTLSNGSLAVESLPRDSQSGSQNGIAASDNSSLLTVQRLLPESKMVSNENCVETSIEPTATPDIKRVSIHKNNSKSIINKVSSLHKSDVEEYEIHESNLHVEENNLVPLSIPTLKLVSPRVNTANEDSVDTVAITSSDVAEHESGERGTTSVTSGSDILRELNPSKTESSESVISTGLADASKHSSDFWD